MTAGDAASKLGSLILLGMMGSRVTETKCQSLNRIRDKARTFTAIGSTDEVVI